MKKLLLILGLSLLLTACGQTSEPIVAQPSPDGIEVDHGEVLGRVKFIDENSVSFSTDLESFDYGNRYALSKDVVIQVMEGDQLVKLPRERAMKIMLSSDSDDYIFSFVLSNDEVLEMTQAVLGEPVDYEILVKADQQTSDLVYVKDVYGDAVTTGAYVLLDPVSWLSDGEGTCTSEPYLAKDLPVCNPNGFLLQNDVEQELEYGVPPNATFYLLSWGNASSAVAMSFLEFEAYYFQHPELAFAPFHLQTNGEESGLVFTSLVQKYIP